MGYTGEAKWCPKASSRGYAKQPRRRAGRRAGAHRRTEEPPTRIPSKARGNPKTKTVRCCSAAWRLADDDASPASGMEHGEEGGAPHRP
jgi:hypothetical protein